MDQSWEQRLVKRYHDKLFKEYPLHINAIFITEIIFDFEMPVF